MPMRGTLRSWNDERGYGFIAPTGGGRELFVHVSAFPRDGTRPTVGEVLTYELGRGKDGKPAAVRVTREALAGPARPVPRPTDRPHSRRIALPLLLLALVAGAGLWGATQSRRPPPAPAAAAVEPAPAPAPAPVRATMQPSTFRCDGRTQCAQMTSCAEATYFLKNCPGVQMDGDGDGTPCEQQWCR